MITVLIHFFQVDDAERKWRAHGTQIHCIEADAVIDFIIW